MAAPGRSDDRRSAPVRAPARTALVVGVIGLTWIFLAAFGVLGSLSDATFAVLGVVAVISVGYGIRRWRPDPAWPWICIGAALALWLVGGFLRQYLGTLGDLSSHRSVIPDFFSLSGYALVMAGVIGLAGMRLDQRRRDLDPVLDAVIASLAALTLAWAYVISPGLSRHHVPLHVKVLVASYPAVSAFTCAIFARLAFTAGRRAPTALRLLLASLTCLLAGDLVYMFLDGGSLTSNSPWLSVPYALGYLTAACAALHPSMRSVAIPVAEGETIPRPGRLVFVAGVLCVPVIVLVTRPAATVPDRIVLGVIVLLLTGAAALRMFRAVHALARSEERLTLQANQDGLTGLPNRSFIEQELDRLLDARRDELTAVALLFLDLDRFKLVNDTLGHGHGDQLLIAVAERLRRTTRATDLVGRIGGDEFVVVMPVEAPGSDVVETAERTRLALHTPFRVGGSEIEITASVGVARRDLDDDNRTAEAMLRDADIAMYQAKGAGGDAVVPFDASMHDRLASRVAIEAELRHALERDELSVHFQPILRLSDEKVVGLEALLRWTNRSLGSVPPDRFIPVAEDSGLIVPIGAWVIDQACAKVAELRSAHQDADSLSVAVNVSVRQLRDDQLLGQVTGSLVRHQLPAAALRIEVTESMVMQNLDSMSGRLAALRDYGVRISIDDFGTGYSSLAYLKRLPIDELKVDRTFVSELGEDDANSSLVDAIVAIAGSLGISTVAEGVETAEQAALLRDLGCAEAQGYFYSKPVPFDQLDQALHDLGLVRRPRLRAVPHSA
jgi:diguanylate cyclase (GGDEF)-like protein